MRSWMKRAVPRSEEPGTQGGRRARRRRLLVVARGRDRGGTLAPRRVPPLLVQHDGGGRPEERPEPPDPELLAYEAERLGEGHRPHHAAEQRHRQALALRC